MVSGGMSFVKYLLFAFNLLSVIFGILLLYSGFSALFKLNQYPNVPDAPYIVIIPMIVVGFVIFFITFLGCCGAIRESACMLITFNSLILVIIVIELMCAGLMFNLKSKLKSVVEEKINNAIKKDRSNLHCCGANCPLDWNNNKHYNGTNTYPSSCCDIPIETNTTCTAWSTKLYTQGCVKALDDEIGPAFGLLGGIAFSNAVIQSLGIVFAYSLSRKISSVIKFTKFSPER